MTLDPRVRAVGRAVPENYVDQRTLFATLRGIWEARSESPDAAAAASKLETMHRAFGVDGRHFSLPLPDYVTKQTFAERNDAWIEQAMRIAERASRDALEQAGLRPTDVDHVFSVTVTGIA